MRAHRLLCPHRGALWDLFYKSICPHGLITPQRPYFPISSHGQSRFNNEFGETQYSLHSVLSISFPNWPLNVIPSDWNISPQIFTKNTPFSSVQMEMTNYCLYTNLAGLPWWLKQSSISPQFRRHRFNPWVGKIPWRRKWQSTPVFLPGESHGRRSLVVNTPWGHKDSDTSECTCTILSTAEYVIFFILKKNLCIPTLKFIRSFGE